MPSWETIVRVGAPFRLDNRSQAPDLKQYSLSSEAGGHHIATTICTGSLMDGLSINLVKYAGIENLSDSDEEILWSEHTDISIVEQCSHAELVVTGEFDEMPGQSDEFYEREASDIKAFKNELKRVIEIIIHR